MSQIEVSPTQTKRLWPQESRGAILGTPSFTYSSLPSLSSPSVLMCNNMGQEQCLACTLMAPDNRDLCLCHVGEGCGAQVLSLFPFPPLLAHLSWEPWLLAQFLA